MGKTRKCDSVETVTGIPCDQDVSVFRAYCENGHRCATPPVSAQPAGAGSLQAGMSMGTDELMTSSIAPRDGMSVSSSTNRA